MESKVYYGEYTLEHWMNLILKKKYHSSRLSEIICLG